MPKLKLRVFDLMDVPETKLDDWKNWSKGANKKDIKVIDNLKDIVKNIKKLGFSVSCIGNPRSPNGFYWGDYPRDYISEVFPNVYDGKEKHIFLIVHLDAKLHIDLRQSVYCDFYNLTKDDMKKLQKYVDKI